MVTISGSESEIIFKSHGNNLCSKLTKNFSGFKTLLINLIFFNQLNLHFKMIIMH